MDSINLLGFDIKLHFLDHKANLTDAYALWNGIPFSSVKLINNQITKESLERCECSLRSFIATGFKYVSLSDPYYQNQIHVIGDTILNDLVDMKVDLYRFISDKSSSPNEQFNYLVVESKDQKNYFKFIIFDEIICNTIWSSSLSKNKIHYTFATPKWLRAEEIQLAA